MLPLLLDTVDTMMMDTNVVGLLHNAFLEHQMALITSDCCATRPMRIKLP